MQLEELKTAVKGLNPEDRRKLAFFILELEKDYFKDTVAPKIIEDLEGLSKTVQEVAERVKKNVKEKW